MTNRLSDFLSKESGFHYLGFVLLVAKNKTSEDVTSDWEIVMDIFLIL